MDEFERIFLVYEPAESIYMRAMEILKATEPITVIETTDKTATVEVAMAKPTCKGCDDKGYVNVRAHGLYANAGGWMQVPCRMCRPEAFKAHWTQQPSVYDRLHQVEIDRDALQSEVTRITKERNEWIDRAIADGKRIEALEAEIQRLQGKGREGQR